MIGSLHAFFHRARPAVVVALAVVVVICLKLFADWRAALAPHGTPDARFWYGPVELREMLSAFTPEQRAQYARTVVTVDIVFPAAYGSLLAILAAWSFTGRRSRQLVLLPLAAAVADAGENAINASLAWSYPNGPWELGYVSGALTTTKWTAVSAIALLLAGAALKKLARRLFG